MTTRDAVTQRSILLLLAHAKAVRWALFDVSRLVWRLLDKAQGFNRKPLNPTPQTKTPKLYSTANPRKKSLGRGQFQTPRFRVEG